MAWYDTSGGQWTKICLRSFRKYFPSEHLIVINNNWHHATPELCEFVSDHASFIAERLVRPILWNSHGRAVDLAVDICRRKKYDILILIEPDCLFKGRAWSDEMIDAISGAYKVAGLNRMLYGPIHPGISAWKVDDIPGSFCAKGRLPTDPADKKFAQNLIDWRNRWPECQDGEEIRNTKKEVDVHISLWDTGLLNSAILDDYSYIIENRDVTHFGGGYSRSPSFFNDHCDYELMTSYLY